MKNAFGEAEDKQKFEYIHVELATLMVHNIFDIGS